jgi:hypothetical protein
MKALIRISVLLILLVTMVNNVHAAFKTNKWYFIESQVNGLNLDVKMGSKKSGTPIWMYTPNKTNAQQWMLVDAGRGYYYIKSRLNGMYLDVRGGSKSPKAIIWNHPKNGTDAQKWKLTSAGGGYYYIKSKVSGLYLDVKGGGKVKKTPVWQYGFNKSKSQKWKLKPVKTKTKDRRTKRQTTTQGDATSAKNPVDYSKAKIAGRYNLPDEYRPSFENVAVWRLQLRVKTSTVKNADSDSKLQVRFTNKTSSIYYLNNGGNDREKNKTDTYEILDPNIKTIGDIKFMKFLIKGNDAWCISKIELLVNGAPVPIFRKSYTGRKCIDGDAAPGPGLYISGSTLRNSATWKHSNSNRAIWLPPSIIKRITLENMVESYVGHMMYADPEMRNNDLAYGYKNGNRYVEATKKAANKLHFDLDLKSHYGIDFEVDVDFDLVIKCQNNKLSLTAESVKGEADIPIISSILNLFGSCFHKMDMGNFNFGNSNLEFCPRVKVTNVGDVTLSL